MRIEVPRRLKEAPSSAIGSYKVTHISHADGTKLFLENDNWALLRFSGTEPYCGSPSRRIRKKKPPSSFIGSASL